MPDYYAHTCFGKAVLQELPLEVRKRIRGEELAYSIGQFGPDPLFFHHPLSKNSPRQEGLAIHNAPSSVILERYRRAIGEGVPWSAGYAAGLVCHFALDSCCHPYIEKWTDSGRITHAAIESELDAFLMRNNGIDPFRVTPMIRAKGQTALFYAAAIGYPEVDGALFGKCLDDFYAYSHLITVASHSPLEAIVNGFATAVPAARDMKGAALKKKPNPISVETSSVLQQMLYSGVRRGAQLVGEYFEDLDRGRPLSEEFRLDFEGRRH